MLCPKWSELQGMYTQQEAVPEFGPPDLKEKMDNGNTLYSWRLSENLNNQTKLLLEFDSKGLLDSGKKVVFYTAASANILEN